MIKFIKLNETYSRIIAEPYIIEEIRQEFLYFADNYLYDKRYLNSQWDGTIALIKKNGIFASGILKEVVLKFKELGYNNFEFEGYDTTKEYTEDSVLEAIETFNLPVDRQLREYQLSAILSGLLGKRKIILSPTSSGKSLLIYIISRMLSESDKKVLVVVPSITLVDQMVDDFISYVQNNEYDVEENTHKIYAGQARKTKKSITVSTWQSIMEVPKDQLDVWLGSYDAVLIDECHLCDGKSLKTIMEKSTNASYRLGFTGTLKDSKSSIMLLKSLFGDIKKMISTKELMDLGYIAKLKIYCIVLKYSDEMRELVSTMDYAQELDTVLGYEKRNNFIANLAAKLEGNTLTLVRFIEKHMNILEKKYKERSHKKVHTIYADVDRMSRNEIKAYLEQYTDCDLIGTYGLISTGVSIINLNNAIFASPAKSKIRVLQSIGRILRKGKNKTHAYAYDIVDDLRYDGKLNHLSKHFIERYKYYKDEGFDVEIIEVKIE